MELFADNTARDYMDNPDAVVYYDLVDSTHRYIERLAVWISPFSNYLRRPVLEHGFSTGNVYSMHISIGDDIWSALLAGYLTLFLLRRPGRMDHRVPGNGIGSVPMDPLGSRSLIFPQ